MFWYTWIQISSTYTLIYSLTSKACIFVAFVENIYLGKIGNENNKNSEFLESLNLF